MFHLTMAGRWHRNRLGCQGHFLSLMDTSRFEFGVYAKTEKEGKDLLYKEYQDLTASIGLGTAPKGMHIEKDGSLEDWYGIRIVHIKSLPHIEIFY